MILDNCKCHISGCRNIETRCKDCNRLICDATFKDKWISVKDRLPELGQEVIFAIKWQINGNYACRTNAMGGIYSDKITGKGSFCDLSLRFTYPEVKYWIPLPELPKE